MPNNLEARVAGALTNVRNPRVDNDVISAGMVRDLTVAPDGTVSLTFVLSTDDPADFLDLVQELRGTESSAYTESETPIFTCISASVERALDALDGEAVVARPSLA